MKRLHVLVIVLGLVGLSSYLSGGPVGASSECINDECQVWASSSLGSCAVAVGLLLFVMRYPKRQGVFDLSLVVGVWRRFAAFLLDCLLVLSTIVPFVSLPALILEAHATGAFQWSFERDFVRSTDMLIFGTGALLTFCALFLYHYWHLRAGRATVGQYIMGYTITAATDTDRKPAYALRVLTAFVGLSVWPVSVFSALRSPDKRFWWDEFTDTRAISAVGVWNA